MTEPKPIVPCPECGKVLQYDLIEDDAEGASGSVPYAIWCGTFACSRNGFKLHDGTVKADVEQRDLHGYVRYILGTDGRLPLRDPASLRRR